jgi:endonuclease YncB( thermonuclease family)
MNKPATNPGKTARFILLSLLLSTPTLSLAVLDQNCRVDTYDQTATVKYIHDGDTIGLRDGRKVRLIGINTPELARENRPAEAFSVEATKALKTMIHPGEEVHLRLGRDKKDHYGRLLAHVFTTDGKNVQAELLQQGYASAIFIPPNTAFSGCYLQQETIARCKHTGIWRKDPILQAKALKSSDIGFHLISGTLQKIHINKKGIWLNIDDKLTVGIRPDNRQLFDIKQLNTMLQQPITVRGWLNKSDKNTPFYLRIKHPAALQLSSEHSCNTGWQSTKTLSN